jgi:hypothetical protein
MISGQIEKKEKNKNILRVKLFKGLIKFVKRMVF